MPTYDYKCDACGHTFELFQSMKDSAKRTCPKCGKKKLQRLIGIGAAVMFKGSGFYETDYRSESYKKSAEADKPATAPAASDASKPAGDAKAAPKVDSSSASKADPAPAAPAPKPETPRTDSKSRPSKKSKPSD